LPTRIRRRRGESAADFDHLRRDREQWASRHGSNESSNERDADRDNDPERAARRAKVMRQAQFLLEM
jgi:hypothetical protein